MKYFAANGEQCAAHMDHDKMVEAQYTSLCLDSLMIKTELESDLLLDLAAADGEGTTACDGTHAAFHPVRSWRHTLRCLEQTGHFDGDEAVPDLRARPSLLCFTLVMPKSYE